MGKTYFNEYGTLLVKFGRALKPRIECVRNKRLINLDLKNEVSLKNHILNIVLHSSSFDSSCDNSTQRQNNLGPMSLRLDLHDDSKDQHLPSGAPLGHQCLHYLFLLHDGLPDCFIHDIVPPTLENL